MINEIKFQGLVEKEPSVKLTPNSLVANIRLVNMKEVLKKNGETFHKKTKLSVTVWGDDAEQCRNFAVGDLVLAEGYFEVSNWKNNDGEWVSTPKLIANKLEVTGNKIKELSSTPSKPDKKETQNYEVQPDLEYASDDIPF